MTDQQSLVVAAVVLIAAAVVAAVLWRRWKTRRLNARFGTEYSRVVAMAGGRRQGEAGLLAREKRLNAMTIRPLSAADQEAFAGSWGKVQAEFVDDPKYSVTHADHLLGEVMTARGYPAGDFEQRAADLSVDHPRVVESYRTVHDIALRHGRGQASTEDLRQSMILYRALFDELIGERLPPPAAAALPA